MEGGSQLHSDLALSAPDALASLAANAMAMGAYVGALTLDLALTSISEHARLLSVSSPAPLVTLCHFLLFSGAPPYVGRGGSFGRCSVDGSSTLQR